MRFPLARRPKELTRRDPSQASISASLRALRPGGRLSLAHGPGPLTENYIQVRRMADDYLVDIRDGSAEHHVEARLIERADVERIWFAWMREDDWRSLAVWTAFGVEPS